MPASGAAPSLNEHRLTEYRIFETDRFRKDLEMLARSGQSRILDKLRAVVYPQLRQHPHFGTHIRRLRDWDPPTWRYRIGAWRFFFEVSDEEPIVYMTAASHRSDAY